MHAMTRRGYPGFWRDSSEAGLLLHDSKLNLSERSAYSRAFWSLVRAGHIEVAHSPLGDLLVRVPPTAEEMQELIELQREQGQRSYRQWVLWKQDMNDDANDAWLVWARQLRVRSIPADTPAPRRPSGSHCRCGDVLVQNKRGRPKRYCSDACRKASARAKSRNFFSISPLDA